MRFVLSLALLATPGLLAGAQQEMTWNELSTLVNRSIRITLPQGTVITGSLTAIQPEAMVLQVKQSSDKRAVAKGRFEVPRAQVKVVSLLSKGKKFRVIGTICGAWIGLGLGGYAAFQTNSAFAAVATLVGVGGGLTTLGYFLEDAADQRSTTIVVRQ